MTFRQLTTDCAIAILLAVPTVPLAKPSLKAPPAASETDRSTVAAAYFSRAGEIRRG